ncbi:MAG: TAT-variant-translocated molybdopterin oxidoreductase [Bdellovibrionaceae bacterium]|nr:TAT-variant-translocated molybdopterin oxidoreductase [Pseudobdellovibrionaceae bacterium]MBX3033492.1 TAT-variant-translocated molybdopterin oxidoreductase [Pseudobdellovibrionaceae bacterium]
MSEKNRPEIQRDQTYWRSLEHYNQDPEFLKLAETEFQSSPLREGEAEDGVARREFLKLMGASLAMATASCVRRPVQKIVPYNKQPEEITLGVPNYYTSSYFDGSESMGLLIKTREGRPIKIEGNSDHPLNRGVSIKGQASILNLYDPERLRGPKKNLFNEKRTNKDTIGANWDSMDQDIATQLKKGGVVVLTGALSGVANRAVVKDFCQAFGAKHVQFEPLSHEEVRAGQKACYGDDLVPFYRFDKAKLIVSVDADFLGAWLMPMTFSGQFAEGRKDIETMSRLVAFDSNYSLTGANADIRVKIKPSQQLDVVLGLLHEIVVKKGRSSHAGNGAVKSVVDSGAGAAARLGIEPALLSQIADDLWENRGRSLVVAGGLPTLTAQAAELQIAVNFLNQVLDNEGKTIEAKNANVGLQGSWADMLALINDMKSGQVKTLIMHKVNPGYVLPKALGFFEAVRKVEMVVSTADRQDETSGEAHFIIPDNHPLETWGDAEPVSGVFMIQQPSIRPMYDTRSFQLSLMTWAFIAKQGPKRLQEYETYYDYLRAVWREEVAPKVARGKSFDDFWLEVLQKGVVGEVGSASGRSFRTDAFTSIKAPKAATGLELVLYPTVMMGDGSNTNASWLHELPDPVTKITWDNYASVSLGFAKKNSLRQGDVIEVTVGGNKLELPVNVQPGLHDDVLAVAIGYGRTAAGKIANNIGLNAYTLMGFNGTKAIASGLPVEFKKTGKTYELANPQGGQTMEGRQIVVEATLKEYLKKKDANIHRHHIWSLWSGHQYNGHKWGMAVDLNSCTGCNACVISCQSENNIPVVGKKYVLQGREMAWIRIDRYYVGTPEDAEVVFQPVMCQHCDNAPCETVCPVVATTHTDDGLNAMTYNRCVGTRYCSNNCPYKVRRFNWFGYAQNIEKPLHMALNPDVTVRTRGVMEKCTFCVQRIKTAVNTAKKENRPLKDGEVKTACQTACPSDGIIFGDMNDPNSQVSKYFKEERAYGLLEEWNAAPAVRYLTKIRNNGKDARHEKGEHA